MVEEVVEDVGNVISGIAGLLRVVEVVTGVVDESGVVPEFAKALEAGILLAGAEVVAGAGRAMVVGNTAGATGSRRRPCVRGVVNLNPSGAATKAESDCTTSDSSSPNALPVLTKDDEGTRGGGKSLLPESRREGRGALDRRLRSCSREAPRESPGASSGRTVVVAGRRVVDEVNAEDVMDVFAVVVVVEGAVEVDVAVEGAVEVDVVVSVVEEGVVEVDVVVGVTVGVIVAVVDNAVVGDEVELFAVETVVVMLVETAATGVVSARVEFLDVVFSVNVPCNGAPTEPDEGTPCASNVESSLSSASGGGRPQGRYPRPFQPAAPFVCVLGGLCPGPHVVPPTEPLRGGLGAVLGPPRLPRTGILCATPPGAP